MEERRDQAIKLFGKMIPLQGSGEDSIGAGEEENKLQQQGVPEKQPTSQSIWQEKIDPLIPHPTKSENSAKPEAKEGAENEKQRKPNGDQEEEEEEEETAAKKPDKIVPCPRCDSLDTKFCYFNNYNVGQPRHFCKNCQRYWTAGGSLRNVPVGAGRRKINKSSPCYRRVNLSPAHPTTVLSFGSDSPLRESMASVLNLAGARNAFESCEDQNSSQSSMTGSSSTTDDGAGTGTGTASAAHKETVAAQISCVNGFPWAYPTSPAPAFAFPLYPAVAYWGYTVPFHSPQHNSPALGKHAREGDKLDDTNSGKSCEEKRLWIPKTLRIDDPEEAARSSIWATIGFKNEMSSAVCGGGLFKPFRSKDDGRKSTPEMPQVLQANPAAFARSMNFCESS